VIAAIDINNNANDVYHHNFPVVKPLSKNLDTITPKMIDSWNTDIWTMSPPCQPYTRQGAQKGGKDNRAASFFSLIGMLPKLVKPPQYIFIENVKGFEESDSHEFMMNQLKEMGYFVSEFMLSPTQIRTPNQRLRYYLTARRTPFPLQPEAGIMYTIPGHADCLSTERPDCHELKNYLETVEENSKYFVPAETVKRYGLLYDLVNEDSRRTNCFTKNYGQFVEGTGSVLQTIKGEGSRSNGEGMVAMGIRWLTPKEIANLMGFPPHFDFPPGLGLKSMYRLLGNSLNVTVVSELFKYMLADR